MTTCDTLKSIEVQAVLMIVCWGSAYISGYVQGKSSRR